MQPLDQLDILHPVNILVQNRVLVLDLESTVDMSVNQTLSQLEAQFQDQRLDPFLIGIYSIDKRRFLKRHQSFQDQNVADNENLILVPLYEMAGMYAYLGETGMLA